MGRNGSTCHPTENYDSSFSAVAHSRVSCDTFKALDLRLQDVCRVLLLHDLRKTPVTYYVGAAIRNLIIL